MKSTIAMTLGLILLASASYAGVTINGTTITFNDASTQSTANPPSDHGGTGNSVSGTDSFIGGGRDNQANASSATVSGGFLNIVRDSYGTIGGGENNRAGDNNGAKWATVGGGRNNTASGYRSTIGGGFSNTTGNSFVGTSTIGGGNNNTATGQESTIGGGKDNTASGFRSTIGGGNNNTANDSLSTVGGGGSNFASGDFSTIGGGEDNSASGYHSTISGGRNNTVWGRDSFGAGRNAFAIHDNSFVWGGASGARTSFDTDTFNVWSAGIYLNGFVAHSSDRNMKEAFSFVSAREVLDKVVEMPVSTWRFKSEDDSVRHIGPMSQDFMAAFGYGNSDKHITATDADGVALAAIQALYELHQEKDAKLAEQAEVNTALRWHNAQLHSRNDALEARLARLEKAILREWEPAPTGTD